MVLVRYRTRGDIELSMKLTTEFTHPSQGARLGELTPYAPPVLSPNGIVTRSYELFQTTNDVGAAGECTRGHIPYP